MRAKTGFGAPLALFFGAGVIVILAMSFSFMKKPEQLPSSPAPISFVSSTPPAPHIEPTSSSTTKKPAPQPQPEPEPKPTPTPPPTITPPPATLSPRKIDLRSVVPIRCVFKDDRGEETIIRGSGVIINASGYILTNRHIVDLAWAEKISGETPREYTFSKPCSIMLFPFERYLNPEPLSTYPENPYPFFDLDFHDGNWDARTEVAYVPTHENLSDIEYDKLDFAILKINEWNFSKYSGVNPELHPAPILASTLPAQGSKLLLPGYAFQSIGVNSFDTFRLLTLTYTTEEVLYGDKKFSTTPFVHYTSTPSPDASGGRSGSPLFYEGYLIGIHQAANRDDRRNAHAVAIQAILLALEDNGLSSVAESVR